MQDYIYCSAALVAMVIHLIINSGFLSDKGKINIHGIREYRVFLRGTFAYYIVDASWGIIAGLGWTNILYFDTILYYLAIAVSVLVWCHFAIAYLELRVWRARMLAWFGYSLLGFYILLSIANSFNSCLFHFDAQGNYVEGPIRCLIFYPLVALNVLMAAFALVKAFHNLGTVRSRRNMVVFLYCLTMAVAIVLQLIWPLWPYYAIGLLVGNCFFHIFVVEDERNELRLAVIERERTMKHMAELEKALELARAAEKAKSMFFSIVSHDIRTPLNAILGYSELLQDGINSPAERSEALKSIRASGTTLLQLVNDVLDLAKMDSGKMTFHPEPVDLTGLTDEVFASFRMAASAKGLELINKTADAPTVLLDEHRFRQILFNLIGNAVKFTKKGSVTVSASYSEKTLEVAVSDTGCGIAPDMLTRILDPFVQVHDPSHSADRARGTGLGLSICNRLVESMGGKLVVESELGKGSSFKARISGISYIEKKPDMVDEPKPVVLMNRLPKHVLVVDDSPVNRSVLTAFLKKAGITAIDQACDGGEALAELDLSLKAGNPHDFVLSDLWMPNVNGLEFIEKLRADSRFSKLPVFALTADTESRRDPRSDLFTGVLLKPVTYGKLMEIFALIH